MGKRLDKFNRWADDHANELIIAEGGILGALWGWLLTDPTVAEWAGKALKKGWKVAKENIHISFGKPGNGPSVTIDGGSGGKKEKIGYYDYMDRCEQRRHEERMAQIKAGTFVNDEGGTVE